MTYDGKHRFGGLLEAPSRREMVLGGAVVMAGVAVGTAGVAGADEGKAPRSAAATSRAGRNEKGAERSAGRARASREEARQPLREEREEKEREPERRKEKSRAKRATALPAAILTTGDWDARKPDSKATVRSGPPKYIVVHHTTTDNVDDFSEGRAKWLARAVQNAHMKQGWGDTGQQFTISRGGYVLEGRHGAVDAVKSGDMVVGVHTAGLNDYAVGIECEGSYMEELPPRELRASLVRLCAWLCKEYDLNPRKAIVPHRKFNPTDCCGTEFARTIPDLRKAVAKAMKGEDGKDEGRKREDRKDLLKEAREEARKEARKKARVSGGERGLLEEFLSLGRR